MEFATKAEAQAENFRKMMLAMVKDLRVIVIKLACVDIHSTCHRSI